ncbi:galactan beta-1,4-galactosyltransferase GALS1-like [Phoenix dactylifera]|uniref:Glycosyltransferase family 92 protein n=1 Tax=Phoenix dactylifera TaxID=42345 RepID=A0A8B8ZYT5_PHODC|nr:galactan beta-1,4-galactosyltransferase GALS1-like [Phoenix dactylifera]XP_038976718.1 galactan beta-1,4-galactosyltransferase GALS1-like [Phoenix dactylifera]
MKPILRKDGVCGGNGGNGGASPSLPLACFDMKPFIATLVVLTLLMAMWQLQPYESFLSSRTSSCPLPNSTSPRSESKLSSSPVAPVSTSTPTIQKAPVFIPPPDPNKRVFPAYGSAASLFVQMGAYRGGAATFAVVGLASKPTHVFGTPWFKCEWVSNKPSAAPVRAKAYKMLPDWGYGRVYTVVVVNCTFPSNPNADNAGGKLLLHAYYSTTSRRYEKFVALEESPGSYDESHYQPPFRYEYLYCGSSLYGNLSAGRIREWMAYHAYFFGPNSHFVFHDAGGVSPEVKAVLEPWVKAGRATVQDIRAQAEYDGYYYNQFLVVNDCLHRYRHAANWTFFFDVDEYLYLPEGRTLASVLDKLSGYTQFTIEQNPMSSKLCVLDPKKDYSKEWGFEKLVFRNSITGVRRDRKYAIQARKAYATGVHMSQNVIGKTTHKTEDMIRYYHYHNSINVLGEPCREFIPVPPKGNATWFEKIPYVYDDNMKRVAGTIKQFEKETIGSIRT